MFQSVSGWGPPTWGCAPDIRIKGKIRLHICHEGASEPNVVCKSSSSSSWVGSSLGLLATHQLEVVDLLEGGDDELAVHVVDLQLQLVDLHLVLLDLVLHLELLGEDGAGLVVQLLDDGGERVFVHVGDGGHIANLAREKK